MKRSPKVEAMATLAIVGLPRSVLSSRDARARPASAFGRSEALIPERVARSVVQ